MKSKKVIYCILLLSLFLLFLPLGEATDPHLGISEGDEFIYIMIIANDEGYEETFDIGLPGTIGSTSNIVVTNINDEISYWDVTIDYLDWERILYSDLHIYIPKDSSSPGPDYGSQFFPPVLYFACPGIFPICAKPVADYIQNANFTQFTGNYENNLRIYEDNYNIYYTYDYESGVLFSMEVREVIDGGPQDPPIFKFILLSNIDSLIVTGIFGLSSITIIIIIFVEVKRRRR